MKLSRLRVAKSSTIQPIFGLFLFLFFASAHSRADSVDSWLSWVIPRASQKLVANISPPDAAKGAVVASPSRVDPDYFFHWIRDAALVMDTVLLMADSGRGRFNSRQVHTALWDYVAFSRVNQMTSNWSGPGGGLGLGEPKFRADGAPYNDFWSRPQNDGPALRAVTLIHFARVLLKEGREAEVRRYLYDSLMPTDSVIKMDLEFVANHWKDASFDLWEEIRGKHFYTRMTQRKALLEGAELAESLGDMAAASFYKTQAVLLSEQIAWHWDSSHGYIQATLDRDAGVDYKNTGLDTAVILGVLHGATADGFFGPCSDPVLATTEAIRDAFNKEYSINAREVDWLGEPLGTALGRYPEDRYDGYKVTGRGNPWFISTAGLAELYFRCANDWDREKLIPVTKRNVTFLKQVLAKSGGSRSNVQVGERLSSTDPRYFEVIHGLRRWGDAMLRRVRFHAAPDGAMSEQMNREHGFMQGASDLTWSYAALLTAAFHRTR